jgi:uncharacterized membrane protein
MKTTTYGVAHMCVAIAVAWAISGDLVVALGIGLIEPFVQTGVFALHDWFWEGSGKTQVQMAEQTCAHRH